jgi:hypothetical protein
LAFSICRTDAENPNLRASIFGVMGGLTVAKLVTTVYTSIASLTIGNDIVLAKELLQKL